MNTILPATVYVLCFGTSCLCAWLLARTYRATGAKLLFWSALCFALLAINNLFVILDLLAFPQIDFAMVRAVLQLAAIAVLLFGFVWNLGKGE